jgi:hypothetical protein
MLRCERVDFRRSVAGNAGRDLIWFRWVIHVEIGRLVDVW